MFKYGPGRGLSLTFEIGLLPNKNRIKGKGGKILAAAILSTWLRKEKSGQENLIALLASADVTIDNGSESNTHLQSTSLPEIKLVLIPIEPACDIRSTHNEAEMIPDNR